jgi:hypothetical protein
VLARASGVAQMFRTSDSCSVSAQAACSCCLWWCCIVAEVLRVTLSQLLRPVTKVLCARAAGQCTSRESAP